VPLVLIGNKSDLNGQRKISYEAGSKLAQEWREKGSQASFIETSALTGEVNKKLIFEILKFNLIICNLFIFKKKVEDVFMTLLNLVDKPTGNNINSNNNTINNQATVKQPSDRPSGGDRNKNCTVS